jgi:hypothetical protein
MCVRANILNMISVALGCTEVIVSSPLFCGRWACGMSVAVGCVVNVVVGSICGVDGGGRSMAIYYFSAGIGLSLGAVIINDNDFVGQSVAVKILPIGAV